MALVAGGFGGARWWHRQLRQPGPLPAAQAIVVPHGTVTQLGRVLAADHLIAHPWQFRAAVWLTRHDGMLRAAEFAFPAHASLSRVLAILRTARPVEHRLTIPEGLTADQIEAIIVHAPVMTGKVAHIPEGGFLPQTYEYEYGASRAALVARGEAAMHAALAKAWANRAPGLPLSSPRQALILASIVERETARPDERPRVAAVYLNRLRKGMRLQADPTVVYMASHGEGVLDHPLTRSELERQDPFNTYRVAGLPPGPICAPGLSSIEAVLHPADSDDLYFVADGTGGHVFSRTLRGHDAAVARWRALQHGKAD